MDWFTKVSFAIPNWAWLVIALVVLAIIIVIIALCVKRKDKAESAGAADDAEIEPSEAEPEKPRADREERTDGPVALPAEKYVEEEGGGREKASDNLSKTDKKAEGQPVQKPATTAADRDGAEKKPANKVYHISKRKDDNKWQVKAAKGAKAIKLFNTQAEAIDFAKALAENQDARIVIHKEDGSFRNLTYKKK